MSISFQLLEDEPIIIAVARGSTTPEQFANLFEWSAMVADHNDGLTYRIGDARFAGADFAQTLRLLKLETCSLPGSITDPRIRLVMVGDAYIKRLYDEVVDTIPMDVPEILFFDTLDDALTHIREQISLEVAA